MGDEEILTPKNAGRIKMEANRRRKLGGKSGIFVILGGLAWVFCTSAFGAASFQGLGDLPGGAYESCAYSVSGDGSVVVGYSQSVNRQAFRWTATGGIVGLSAYTAYGASSNGSVIVGGVYLGGSRQAFRWTVDGGVVGLGYLPGAQKSDAFGVSADGLVVVGVSSTSPTVNEATRWTWGGGMVGLGDLSGGDFSSFANGVSADGLVVIGHGTSASGSEAFRWTAATGMVGLGDLAGGIFKSQASAVSADGSVVVGYGNSSSGQEAFRWTSDGGMVGLGDLEGGAFKSNALAISADGSIVVGSSSSALNSYYGEAFYWTELGGMQSLKDVLINLGADLTAWDGTTWTLTSATGISADGKTIVGYGSNGGSREAWIAVLPSPKTHYVDADANGANDGSSWADAFNYLQDALTAANYGDEIRVAEGSYEPDQGAGITPGDRQATFQLKNGVALYGGYAGFSAPDPNDHNIQLYQTILSGDLNGDDVDLNDPGDLLNNPCRAENSYHVVTGSNTYETAILNGFVIRGGNADGSYPPHYYGGGMLNFTAYPSPTVTNCTFIDNSAAYDGGGMLNWSGTPMVTNCTFKGNCAYWHGGGMYNYCSHPSLTNCIFTSNSAPAGGGMCNYSHCNPKLTQCAFRSNSAVYGGGMYNWDTRLWLVNCVFSGNSAANAGGGICNRSYGNTYLTNCMFSGNFAEEGGGMWNDRSFQWLSNCTFIGNKAKYFGGMSSHYGGKLWVSNCILWANTDSGGTDESSQIGIGWPFVNYCCLQGWTGRLEGTGNTGSDPCFVAPGYWGDANDPNIFVDPNDPNSIWVDGDYRLRGGSPCIDAGSNTAVSADTTDLDGDGNTTEQIPWDLDGNPRVYGGRVDMGAYEAMVINHLPVACVLGGDRVVEADSNCEGRVTLDGSCSSDEDSTAGTNDDINDFDWYEVVDVCDPNSDIYLGSGEVIECNLGLGEHLIVLEVTDKAGAFDSNEVVITVEDVTPPEFSLFVEPNVLWPPNHRMVRIDASWEVSDNCDEEVEVSLVGVTSSEQDDGRGDGRTKNDIVIGDDGSIYLRAERTGSGAGRVYTITYEAVDDSGNATEASAEVLVPDGYRWRHRERIRPKTLDTGPKTIDSRRKRSKRVNE